MKNKVNKARIVWVTCLFLLLIVILVMVMDYKINHEYSSPSLKLYFYECDGSVCTTTVKDNNKNIYSYYDCWGYTCPDYKKIINDDYALLEENTSSYVLFNYKEGKTITSGYKSYMFIDNTYIIVNKGNKYGVIDTSDNITVSCLYDSIGIIEDDLLKGYNTSGIIAMKDGKYGIISYKDGKIIEEFTYDKASLNKLLEKIK